MFKWGKFKAYCDFVLLRLFFFCSLGVYKIRVKFQGSTILESQHCIDEPALSCWTSTILVTQYHICEPALFCWNSIILVSQYHIGALYWWTSIGMTNELGYCNYCSKVPIYIFLLVLSLIKFLIKWQICAILSILILFT